jgi:hypothetical protein
LTTATSNCGSGAGGSRRARSGGFAVNSAVTLSTTIDGTFISFGSSLSPSFSMAD